MANITDKQINAKPKAKDQWLSEVSLWGHGSLVARITPSGERLFYFRYQNSKNERVTLPIGTYSRDGLNGSMTLATASTKAKELANLHKSGIRDVKEYLEKEQAIHLAEMEEQLKAKEQELFLLNSRKTVNELFEHWAAIDLINRKDKGAETRRMFQKDVLPIIGHIPVEDIKKGHITEVTDVLLARGVNRMAKLIFSLMRQMFRFAVDRDLLESDPTASIRKAKIGGKDTERDRVLDENEIIMLAKNIPEARLLATTELAIWITLSTCCRIGELSFARWEHIDLNKRVWIIPPENSKNGRQHQIYLSDFTVTYFQKLQNFTGSSKWCYPNSSNTASVCSKTITKQLSDRQRLPATGAMTNRSKNTQSLVLPNGKWTPHDLRRTGATIMTALQVLPEVAERCLNHVEENKIKRVYQRHSYANEMAEAWQKLGEYLEKLIAQ